MTLRIQWAPGVEDRLSAVPGDVAAGIRTRLEHTAALLETPTPGPAQTAGVLVTLGFKVGYQVDRAEELLVVTFIEPLGG